MASTSIDQDSIKEDTENTDTPENPNKPTNIENESDMVTLQESGAAESISTPLENETPMASLEDNTPVDNNITTENDSGMASLQDSSKDVTPEKPNKPIVNEESDDEDFEDETIGERLWGLTEMFPESIVNGTSYVASRTRSGVKVLYNLSRNVLWIFFSSSVVLVAPLLIEVERAQMLESQRSQEKQILLGSNAAHAANLGPSMAMIPPTR